MDLHRQPAAKVVLKKYFVFSTIERNRTCGHCQLCNQDYKDKAGIFSNFIKHLKRKHLPEYERTFKKRDEGLLEEEIIESDGRPTTELSTSKFKQAQ
ncbi:unnamed protein product [Rotaria sp. Silwood2]|nr:unnamed protein product [Rotaria sp. Silwood2]CAF3405924.1 unnamed protein product [Rotaria sp. Silwood2]CAF4415230.1 unnamed protein product [Rotaria sp. Silwood2]CAF4458288.1 unnamed protein product [Rotaria sp. Silwood2]